MIDAIIAVFAIIILASAAIAERCVYRGGDWGSGANAGVFSLSGDSSRSNVSTGIGFRSAFIPEIG